MEINGNIIHHSLWSLLIAFCISAPRLDGQEPDTSFILLDTIPGNFQFFTTDKLLQVYAVTPTNEVIKYNATGREAFRFNNNTLGQLELVDATNPFNLLLYYPDYQTAITLDRTLSQTGQINLLDHNFFSVPVVALSNDNNIWLYDNLAFQLKKIDPAGQVLAKSDNLTLLLRATPNPVQIIARENLVYLNDLELGILVFDNFGQYHRKLEIKQVKSFQTRGNQLLYHIDNQLFSFNIQSLNVSPLSLPANLTGIKQMRIQKNRLYLLKENRLEIYRYGGERY